MGEKILQQILVEMQGLTKEVSGIKSDVSSIKLEITGIKSEVSGIKSEIFDIKSEITSIKSQLDENTQIVKVIRDRQEETDAKLENLTMEVHHVRGDLTALSKKMISFENQLEFNSFKTYINEKEIFNLRKSSIESNSN
ncbi:hypothetical protein [Sporosarcina sp. FA9]|uniref:hypothetical protein n=1 Tax=Sporosarcina sp. FA9 TaxID=3413030 RepID=UPI003F6579B1